MPPDKHHVAERNVQSCCSMEAAANPPREAPGPVAERIKDVDTWLTLTESVLSDLELRLEPVLGPHVRGLPVAGLPADDCRLTRKLNVEVLRLQNLVNRMTSIERRLQV